MKAFILFLFTALMLLVAPDVALAQSPLQITRSPATAPTLGTTVRGSSATTFSITTGGSVTRTSGNAIRLSTSSVTAPTITVSCGLLNLSSLCALRYVRITITPVTGAGPASISRLRVGSLSGASYRSGSAPAEGASITFDINPLGLFGSATFTLGMDVLLAAGAASGNTTFTYNVLVDFTT